MSDDRLPSPRDRILTAASRLLAEHGRDGVSTRAVSAAAAVQPQTIYRQYGDMQGLLNAVAKNGFSEYLRAKSGRGGTDDAIDDFRHGWDMHVEFALGHPALYALMYGDPRPGVESATVDIEAALSGVLQRVALAGRLTVSVERAVQLVLAANVGTALALLSASAGPISAGVESELSVGMREMLIASLMDERDSSHGADPGSPVATAAVSAAALGASLPAVEDTFTPGELALLTELLGRVGRQSGP